MTAYFKPALFDFMIELAANNERAWFMDNKARYERDVRDPMLAFITDLAPLLKKIAPKLVADPRPNGSSIFRIHRDTRFSKDKTPYKTNLAAHFSYDRAQSNIHGPGLYIQLANAGNFGGGGMWRPEPDALLQLRQSIVHQPARWKALAKGGIAVHGERLKRPPKGFDPAHPEIESLKLKDFLASEDYAEADVCADGFLDRYAAMCAKIAPLLAWQAKSLGMAW